MRAVQRAILAVLICLPAGIAYGAALVMGLEVPTQTAVLIGIVLAVVLLFTYDAIR